MTTRNRQDTRNESAGRQADSARRRQRVIAALGKRRTTGPRSASPASPAPRRSTAPSFTVTATCWRKSTHSKPPRRRRDGRRDRRHPRVPASGPARRS